MLEPSEIKRWERLTDAMLNHAATDDPEAFAQVVAVLERAQGKLPEVARSLRTDDGRHHISNGGGYSWANLARALGISRQAAQQRYGR